MFSVTRSVCTRRYAPNTRRYFSNESLTSQVLRPTIKQLLASTDVSAGNASEVEVHGWVRSVRHQKRVAFAAVGDGSCPGGLQAVFGDPSLAKSLTTGACVRLKGKLASSPGKGQSTELQVEEVQVLGKCDPEIYPIQKQALTTEYLRDHPHLRPRTEQTQAMLRVRDNVMHSIHNYFSANGFHYGHMPVITSSDCEGGGEAFRLAPLVHDASPSSGLTTTVPQEFFGQPAYLTVSSQLHLEALAASLARVYNLGPCFRAEPSQTSRHLAEFWMLEAEWAFCNSVSELSGFIEGAIKHVLSALPTEPVLPSQADPSRTEALRAAADPSKPWARMTYTEAIAELEKHSDQFEFKPVWGHGLQSEHERFLAGTVVKGPVFVTDYPASIKPFYCRANAPDSEGRETVACLDLLVPGVGELVGGAVREERLELLEAAIKKAGLSEEEYSWYVDLRRHGSAPHGGFGMGFERLIGWVTGIENVRECVAMPRWAGRMLL